jgi:lipoprotein-anchoring transpeptidase ErfK/SrfK
MRRGRALIFRVIEVIGVFVLFACIAVGVTVTRAARVSEPQSAAAKAREASKLPAKVVSQVQAALKSGLRFIPGPGATDVAPDAPIVVTAPAGELGAVHVTSSSGVAVAGERSSAADRWQSTGPLAYGTVYRVTAAVSGALRAPQVQTESTVTFRTLTPQATVTAAVFPNSGLTLGVGQPVAFRLSQEVFDAAARASLISHLTVTASPPVHGGWHWFSNRELHFRPQGFWPTGEKVTVAWNLNSWNAGGAWGAGSDSVHFGIGDARVSVANLATHLMTVTLNGRTIATYPISGGKPTDPTMAGVHIVLDRQSVVRMNSATNGVPVNSSDGYNELVYNDVHISDTGEYVHAAPWSVTSQGHMNVSHGCINLSPANAAAYFAFSRVGDVVIVTGSPRPPVVGDHGVMDWDTAWSEFTPAATGAHPAQTGVQLGR